MNRALAGAIIMATIAGCGLSLSVALLSVRLDIAGYSAHAIGLNTAAAGIASLLGAPFVPRLAKRIGVARLLMIALGIGGLTLLGFTLTRDYAVWLLLRFVLGMAVTVLFVLSEYWITTASTSDRRGLAIGLYATSLGIGFALGPVLLAAVGTSGNLPFFIGTALFWGAILPLMANTPSAPMLETRSRKPFWMFLKEAPVATLAGLLHGAIEVAAIGLLPVYALRAGASAEQGVLFASIFVLGAGTMQVPLGLLSDRIDRRKLLLVIAIVGFLGSLVLAAVGLSSLILFEVLLLLWGGVVGGLYPVGLAHLGARYRDGELAGANAAFVMTYSLGMLIGPPLIGIGLDVAPRGFFLAITALIGLYLVIVGGRLLKPRSLAQGKAQGSP